MYVDVYDCSKDLSQPCLRVTADAVTSVYTSWGFGQCVIKQHLLSCLLALFSLELLSFCIYKKNSAVNGLIKGFQILNIK